MIKNGSYVNPFFPDPSKDAIRTTPYGSILAFQDDANLSINYVKSIRNSSHRILVYQAYSAGVTVIDRERKSWQQWDNDAAFPRGTVAVRSNDAMNQGISNPVLNFNVPNHGATETR